MRVLVVSAHPDDETLGAGGTVARHARHGDEVWVCVLTDGRAPYGAAECTLRAADVLGDVDLPLTLFKHGNDGFCHADARALAWERAHAAGEAGGKVDDGVLSFEF